MTQPSQLAVEIDLLYDLATKVKERFMPFVFNCPCNGEQESCKKALNDPRVWERLDAVTAIRTWLLEQAYERENQLDGQDEES